MSGKTTSSPTIADVARDAGVSITTVSRFLNGSSLLAEDTVSRVREAIQKLGYLPRSAARNLALQRTNTLGMLIESIGTSFFAEVVAGAEEAAYEEGYSLLIATTSHTHHENSPAIGPFNTDGLLVVNVQLGSDAFPLPQQGYPVVCLYQPAPRSLNIPLITIQNKRGTFQAIEHLIKVHGKTKIGFLRGPVGNADSHWRELGYRQALKRYGIPVDEGLIGAGGFSFPVAQQTILEWARCGQIPEAIFTGNDESALAVSQTIARMGLRIPEDVAIIGFDDSSMASTLFPPLTTVRAPIQDVGREGIKRLLKLIRTGEAEPLTLLPTELVIRNSCGCTVITEPDTWPKFPRVMSEMARSIINGPDERR